MNLNIGVVLRLILNKRPYTVADGDHALDAVFRRHGNLNGVHSAVLSKVELAVYHRIAKVSHGRVCGNREVFVLCFEIIQLELGDLSVDVLNSVLQQISQLRIVIRNASRLRTVCAADHLHIAKHHFRVTDKV